MEITSFDLKTNEPQVKIATSHEPMAAWEEVEPGRFRPRRICGSYVGRELG